MIVHEYDPAIPLDDLVADMRRAVAGWSWKRGAYGHALSLPAYRELHPHARYAYDNFPCSGLLARCPAFRALFHGLRSDKVSFCLLRRPPASSYAWHADRWKGPGVVRFQIPLLSDPEAFLVTTDYTHEDQIVGPARVTAEYFPTFAAANAGHVRQHHLALGRLHYFDTTRVHTLVNPGPNARVTLSFDLVANDWVRARFPAIRAEIGDGPVAPLPRPGRLANGGAWLTARLHPLRSAVRRWRGRVPLIHQRQISEDGRALSSSTIVCSLLSGVW